MKWDLLLMEVLGQKTILKPSRFLPGRPSKHTQTFATLLWKNCQNYGKGVWICHLNWYHKREYESKPVQREIFLHVKELGLIDKKYTKHQILVHWHCTFITFSRSTFGKYIPSKMKRWVDEVLHEYLSQFPPNVEFVNSQYSQKGYSFFFFFYIILFFCRICVFLVPSFPCVLRSRCRIWAHS